ncbi:MAG: LLM class flavin-dependent oxidoreductase [Thaumarchaeota archaeon]|nr:LLM class flavin-dependent oxidoreductase [Nitrososphaerota archaeon]
MELGVGYTGDASIVELLECAKIAERKGLRSVWLADHYCLRELVVCMTAVSMSTRKIKVAAGTANAYTRHAATYAMSLATLRELAGDRFILGLGAAVRPQVSLLGGPLGDNVTRLRELIFVVRKILSGEELTYKGKTIHVDKLKLGFDGGTRVPIYLGGIGHTMVRMAGELCDGLVTTAGGSVSYVKEAMNWLREGAIKAGRDVKDVKTTSFVLLSASEDSRQAKEKCKKWLTTFLAQPYFKIIAEASGIDPEDVAEATEAVKKQQLASAFPDLLDRLIDEFAVAGTPKYCRKRIDEFAEIGVDQLVIMPMGSSPSQTLLAMTDVLGDYLIED